MNLIEKHGQLKELGQRYESALHAVDVKSRWYDFHAECKNRAYHKLDELADSLADTLNEYGFFMAELAVGLDQRRALRPNNCKVKKTQTGVIRTNCVGSIDRTNVVQSVLAHRVIHVKHSDMWADNGDVLSKLFIGHPATKTDFLRKGKRTWSGEVQDLLNSVRRLYTSQFRDGYHHDCVDLALGKLPPTPNLTTRQHKEWQLMCQVSAVVCVAAFGCLHQTELCVLAWLVGCAVAELVYLYGKFAECLSLCSEGRCVRRRGEQILVNSLSFIARICYS